MLKTIEASFLWIIFLLIEDKEILAQNSLFNLKIIHKKLSIKSYHPHPLIPAKIYLRIFISNYAQCLAQSWSDFSFFHPPSFPLLDSSLLSKRNEGGPPSPFFHARFICTTYFVHAISRDSCRRHGTRTAKPFDYRPATAYRRLSVWNTGHPRISPSPPIMLISR